MNKRKTGLLYFAGFFILLGILAFVMPLIRGGEVRIFSLFGEYAVYAKIGCLVAGGVLLVIGLIRLLGGPKTPDGDEEKKQE
jgi:hypothetical protein